MYYLGIDIGGMSIKCGLVSVEGEILYSQAIQTENHPQEEQIKRIARLIFDVLAKNNLTKSQIKGVGIGCPGAIIAGQGIVKTSANLKWTDFPLKDLLSKEIGIPVRVANDADSATLGEAIFGVAKNKSNVILLTLGTGIGGGIVINKKLYEGHAGTAGELGHIVMVKNGLPCGCGRNGCYEQYASATALIRQTKEAMLEDKTSKMWEYANGNIENVNGVTAFACAKQGDKLAQKVVDTYIEYIAEGILDYCNIFRPEMIILGGGISKEGEYLTDKIKDYLEKYNYGYKGTPKAEIVTAKLKNGAGIVGAASLIAEEF